MEKLKNIFQIILLFPFLLKKGIDSSSGNQLDLPDLNDNSVERKDEIENCINDIYTDLNCIRPAPSRLTIPKEVFGTINYNNLKLENAKTYFMYLHDQLTVKKNRLYKPKIMENPIEFCNSTRLSLIHPSLKGISCIRRLDQFYDITDDTTKVIKHAFKYLVIHPMEKYGDYAFLYYHHIYQFLNFIDNLETPAEFCGLPTKNKKKKRVLDPDASTSDPKKAESSRAGKR